MNPIEIVQRRFVVSGFNSHIPCAGVSGFGIHAQDHLLVGGADERVVKIWQARDRRVVDCQNVIARLHIHADVGQWRAGFLVPIFAWQNPLDAIRARGRIAREFRAEQAKLYAWSVGALTAANISVAIVQLANELA